MNRPIRILTVLGTRPEAVKLAPVLRALKADPSFAATVCSTGQHRELLGPTLDVLGVRPDVDLKLMSFDQSLSQLTSRAIAQLEPVLAATVPDAVLVHGDPTTALAAALAAYYEKIPVGHIEAGLRSGEKYSPFPEEINRKLVDHLSDFCFAPTPHAADNLFREGIAAEKVWVTGNTVIDALNDIIVWVDQRGEQLLRAIDLEFDPKSTPFILVTSHRRENFGAGLENICCALRQIARRNPKFHIVYPVHSNPRVQWTVNSILKGHDRIHPIAPLDYGAFIALLRCAYLVLTDSGGLQEEAPALNVPVLVLRNHTERPEGVATNVARLVGTESANIVCETEKLLNDGTAYQAMRKGRNPYGDGTAARQIVSILKKSFSQMLG